MIYSRALKVIVGLAITVVLTSGCALNRVNLVERKAVTVENVTHAKVNIYGVNVYQDHRTLVVSGSVVRRHNIKLPVKGHVDLTLIASNGSILKVIGTRYSPYELPGRRAGRSYFKANFPLVLPSGARVRVEFHNIPDITPCEVLPNEEKGPKRPEKRFKTKNYPTYVT